jgi:hypothetical protein
MKNFVAGSLIIVLLLSITSSCMKHNMDDMTKILTTRQLML